MLSPRSPSWRREERVGKGKGGGGSPQWLLNYSKVRWWNSTFPPPPFPFPTLSSLLQLGDLGAAVSYYGPFQLNLTTE